MSKDSKKNQTNIEDIKKKIQDSKKIADIFARIQIAEQTNTQNNIKNANIQKKTQKSKKKTQDSKKNRTKTKDRRKKNLDEGTCARSQGVNVKCSQKKKSESKKCTVRIKRIEIVNFPQFKSARLTVK